MLMSGSKWTNNATLPLHTSWYHELGPSYSDSTLFPPKEGFIVMCQARANMNTKLHISKVHTIAIRVELVLKIRDLCTL